MIISLGLPLNLLTFNLSWIVVGCSNCKSELLVEPIEGSDTDQAREQQHWPEGARANKPEDVPRDHDPLVGRQNEAKRAREHTKIQY